MRFIFHIDVNSAFLSWSAVKRLEEEPGAIDLRTIPSAVGGDVETRHGVITARSIPAKSYGVKTGEPVVKALQKCPRLVLVRSDFETYRRFSSAFIELLLSFSELLEQASIDEAYLDVTDRVRAMADRAGGRLTDISHDTEESAEPLREQALVLAGEIRRSIRERLGFTVNVGISTNKLLAKMASDFRKPDLTHTLYPDEIASKLWPLPINELYGCGPKTAAKLSQIGISTIGDAAHISEEILTPLVGAKASAYIIASANGIADDEVRTAAEPAKSYSNETTTPEDITASNYDSMSRAILKELSEHVARRLARDSARGSTIVVTVKTDDFHRHSRQITLKQPTNEPGLILSTASDLMRGLCFGSNGLIDQGHGLRLVGVGVTNLEDVSAHEQLYSQGDIFTWMEESRALRASKERRERLDNMLKEADCRFGLGAIRKGV